MGGGHHDTGVGLVVTSGKGQGGHGHEGVINAHLDAVGGQHTGSGSGENVGVDAAVIGDSHQLIAALGLDPVGKALGSLTDNVNVHPVGASAQHAPQTGGTEFQRHGEAFLDLLVLTGDAFQFLSQRGVLQIGGQPALIIVHVHIESPFPSL